MHKSVRLKNIYRSFFLFLTLYQPVLLGVSALYYMLIWTAVGLVFSIIRGNKKLKLEETVIVFFTVLIFMVFYNVIATLRHYHFSYTNFYMVVLVSIIEFYYFTRLFNFNDNGKEMIKSVFINVIKTQIVIVLIMLLIPPIKNFYSNYVLRYANDYAGLTQNASTRIYGIAGPTQYLYALGLVHGLAALFFFYEWIKIKKANNMILCILSLVVSLLNARIGVIAAVPGVVLMFVLLFMSNVKRRQLLEIIVTVTIGIGLIFIFFNNMSQFWPETYNWLMQGVEAIKALWRNDQSSWLYMAYEGLLPQNWILPKGLDFWIGAGKTPEFLGYYASGMADVGYVRIIHVSGCITLLGIICCLLYLLFNDWKYILYSQKIYRISILIFVIISNIKGDFFVQMSAIFTLLLLLRIDKKVKT